MSDALRRITFREMLPSDVAAGLALCRASRWNQVNRDWECLLNLSCNGGRVAVKENRVVGTVITLRYRNRLGQSRFSWIGMVLVDPAERRQGIGSQLMQEALNCLSNQKTIRLDATPAGHAVYKKLGFFDEYALTRMEAPAAGRQTCGSDSPARPMTAADLPHVMEMDLQVFGADRGTLLRWLFEGAPEYSWVSMCDGRIAGYSFGRHGFHYQHLGPVIAGDCPTATQLLVACLSDHGDRSFILDALPHNAEWMQCIEAMGFREQRPFIRMFRGENRYPGVPEKQFAILGPEFG